MFCNKESSDEFKYQTPISYLTPVSYSPLVSTLFDIINYSFHTKTYFQINIIGRYNTTFSSRFYQIITYTININFSQIFKHSKFIKIIECLCIVNDG